MKKLLLAATAAGFLAAAAIAVAQDNPHGAKADEGARTGADEGHPARGPEQKGAAPAPSRSEQPEARPGGPPGGPSAQRATRADSQSPGPETTRRAPSIAPLQRNVQASNRYHASAYQPPPGYAYRQWSYGQRLPISYYASSYWIADYLMYSLFAPPPGLVWVRVGDDALLVDPNTGEVMQVQYGIFY
jgi:Ni/Co efflux regulator RcnB